MTVSLFEHNVKERFFLKRRKRNNTNPFSSPWEFIPIAEPVNMDSIRLSLNRNWDTFGCDFEFTDGNFELRFDESAGLPVLEEEYDLSGFKAEVYLVIQNEAGEEFFNGKLDFEDYRRERTYAVVGLFITSGKEEFNQVNETPTELRRIWSFGLNTEPLNSLRPILTEIHDRGIPKLASFAGSEDVESPEFGREVVQVDEGNDFLLNMPIVADETGQNFSYPLQQDAVGVELNTKFIHEATEDGSVEVAVDFTILADGTGRQNMDLDLIIAVPGKGTTTLPFVYVGDRQYLFVSLSGSGGTAGEYRATGKVSFDLVIGDRLYVYGRYVSGDSNTITLTQWAWNAFNGYYLLDQSIEINYQTVFENTWSYGYLMMDALERLCNVIGGFGTRVYSEVLGRTSLGYEKDGALAYALLFNGARIRGFVGSLSPITASFKDLFEGLRSLFCLGYNYEKEIYSGVNALFLSGDAKVSFDRPLPTLRMGDILEISGSLSNNRSFTVVSRSEDASVFTLSPAPADETLATVRVEVKDKKRIRVERIEHFFRPVEIMRLEKPTDIETETASDLIFSEVKVGFKEWDKEVSEVSEEHATDRTYLLPQRIAKKKFDIRSGLIGASYTVENLRRQQLELGKSEGTNFDDKNFILMGRPHETVADAFQLEKDEYFESVEGVQLKAQATNLKLLMERIFLNWSPYLGASMVYDDPTEIIAESQTKGVQESSSRLAASQSERLGDFKRALVASGDIPVSAMNPEGFLFKPVRHSFRHELSRERLEELRKIHKGESPLPMGFITFNHPKRGYVSGFLEKLSWNPLSTMAELTLIESNVLSLPEEEEPILPYCIDLATASVWSGYGSATASEVSGVQQATVATNSGVPATGDWGLSVVITPPEEATGVPATWYFDLEVRVDTNTLTTEHYMKIGDGLPRRIYPAQGEWTKISGAFASGADTGLPATEILFYQRYGTGTIEAQSLKVCNSRMVEQPPAGLVCQDVNGNFTGGVGSWTANDGTLSTDTEGSDTGSPAAFLHANFPNTGASVPGLFFPVTITESGTWQIAFDVRGNFDNVNASLSVYAAVIGQPSAITTINLNGDWQRAVCGVSTFDGTVKTASFI